MKLYVKQLREQKEWRISDLITKSNLDRKTIAKAESESGNLSLETIGRLAVAFEVPICALFGMPADNAPVPKDSSRLKLHVKQARMEKGLTLKELSAKANIAESLLSRMEAETITPKLETMYRLEKALDVPVYDLFGLE